MANQESKQEDVNRVGVRVPPFWMDDPSMWFSQIENQFKLAGITSDETKFCYVSANLEPQYAKEVRDIIAKPPATDKYEKFKTELINRLTASKERRVKQLLMYEELGDRKPSQFLRHLIALAGSDIPDDFMITMWTSRLPLNIQTAIATQKGADKEKLMELADVVYDLAPSSPQVASSTSADTDMARQISELTRQVALLTQQVSRRNPRHRSRQRRYRRSRSQSRSSLKQPPADHPHCFYHYNFGAKANKCSQPCSFKSENSRGGRK